MPAQPRVVILGAGFAGAYCARELAGRRGRSRPAVTLIDRNNYLLFYPLLVEAGTGSLEPRHVTVPVRSFLRRGSAGFVMGEIGHVDLTRREVAVRPAMDARDVAIPFDHLVIALGSVTRLPDVPGLAEYGHQIKSVVDAVALRDRAITALEAASATTDSDTRRCLLHFVVVGGNFTGVEVAGEFNAFLRAAARLYPGLAPGDCRVTLVEIGDRLLGPLDPGLAEYARRHLEKRGVDVRLRASVREIGEDHVILHDGSRIAARTVIWCAGIAPNPVVARIGLPTDARGYILCDETMRVSGHENLWAAGDCAVVPGPAGRPSPPTAQEAVRQGPRLARNVARALEGRPVAPHRHRPLGSLVALGCRSGVAEVLGVKLAGFPAWWLYRTVYLLKMPGAARKLRIAIDWTLDLLFSRDYVQLGVHRRARRPVDPGAS